MKKLKQNAFWVGIGVAAAALVVFFAAVVGPKVVTKNHLQTQVNTNWKNLDRERDVPGTGDIQSYKDAKALLVKNYHEIGSFYSQSKAYLERWLPNLSQDPSGDAFMGQYRTEFAQIETALKQKGIQIGIEDSEKSALKYHFGFNWEDVQPPSWERIRSAGDEKKVLRELQKRYWARKKVADAILTIAESGGKINRVYDFRFFKKLHPVVSAPPDAPWESYPTMTDAIHYMGVGAPLNTAPQAFTEYDLPQKLGKTLTFGFALELPFSQVPRVISEMLNPGADKGVGARLLINVTGATVTIHEQNPPEIVETVMQGDAAAKAKAKQSALEKVKPVDVLLTVTCQIIDFESSELQKFDGSGSAAPAEAK